MSGTLDSFLIGGREKREIVIVDYDPGWPARYELERDRVRRALGASALRVEHIGSTAVRGLAAKPIVDLLVTVAQLDDDSATTAALEAAGYELRDASRHIVCFAHPSGTSTCTSGEIRIPRSRGTWLSATSFVDHRRIVVRMSGSSGSWQRATGPI
jgi:GrpB-like predicted nucleotidyltransferase (UPF0157 family)